MPRLAKICSDTQALPPSTNRPPPSQHQYANSGHAAHQRVHPHYHIQGTPASSPPHQAFQSGANATARDIKDANLLTPPNYNSTQRAAYMFSWTTSPFCPLALHVVARGNKPADIVISPRNSDAEYYYVYIHTIHIMSIDMVIEISKLMLLHVHVWQWVVLS